MKSQNKIDFEFNSDELERYSRHMLLPEIGESGQKELKASSVLCVGCGGLGSPLLIYLASAGIGRIGIIDPDLVEKSNLQRQVIHSTSWVGSPKTDSAKSRMQKINPNCTVPVLLLDDGTRYTSTAGIRNYLEALHPTPSLMGENAMERERFRR